MFSFSKALAEWLLPTDPPAKASGNLYSITFGALPELLSRVVAVPAKPHAGRKPALREKL